MIKFPGPQQWSVHKEEMTRSECSFNRHATYFDSRVGGNKRKDAVSTLGLPYDEHAALA